MKVHEIIEEGLRKLGGKGSGNFGHAGRPGKRGGSTSGGRGGGISVGPQPVSGVFPSENTSMRQSTRNAQAAIGDMIRTEKQVKGKYQTITEYGIRDDAADILEKGGFTRPQAEKLVSAYKGGGAYSKEMETAVKDVGEERGLWMRGRTIPSHIDASTIPPGLR